MAVSHQLHALAFWLAIIWISDIDESGRIMTGLDAAIRRSCDLLLVGHAALEVGHDGLLFQCQDQKGEER